MTAESTQITSFFEDLAVLLGSGSNLNRSLALIVETIPDNQLKSVLQQVRQELQQGTPFSECAAQHPKYFGSYAIGMIKSGEASGNLNESLQHLAEQLESDRELRSQISTALIYPSILLVAMGLSLTVILGVILPKFTELFESFEAQLSPAGHVLMAIANFTNNWGMEILALLIISVSSIWLFRDHIQPKTRLINVLTKIPSIKSLLDQIDFARFTATLASLLESGLSQTQALTIAKESFTQERNIVAIGKLTSRVKEGTPLGEALMELNSFDNLYAHSISNGERAGHLANTLRLLATRLEKDFSKRAHRFALVIEPIMIVGLGVLVGLVVYTVFSALQNLGNIPL